MCAYRESESGGEIRWVMEVRYGRGWVRCQRDCRKHGRGELIGCIEQ